ncbi:hypothetical protein KP79_PYT21345 [Mizuhopecten yessoensis]|uniref:Uncharacterized protein n=1 Tax=Mizuhopecten yessoensis TaxID=6573 RepID=A0A210PKX7_MIZYE|nr:hypothetical protein KP79_PYT21345 [Mizuhopecten yessoensis]
MAEKGQVNIKVKILTAPRQRTSKFGAPLSSIDVLENRTFATKTLYMPTAMTPKAPVGSFCLIRNWVVEEFIRATQKSMIMACGPFLFDRKVEEDFLAPEVMAISEAQACPPKRRLSLSGTLVSVSCNKLT